MKSTLKNMVLVLFTITAISALLVALVQDITKDAIAAANEHPEFGRAFLDAALVYANQLVANEK